MTNNKNNPLLYFNFKNSKGEIAPLLFKNPEKVIVARQIEDVIPCLEQVQEAVNEGYYAAGYMTYEAAPAFDKALKVHSSSKLPLLWFGIFARPTAESVHQQNTYQLHSWQSPITETTYHKHIETIKEQINKGYVKQVNYTIPLRTAFKGDAFSYYQQLVKAQEADYTAYLNIDNYAILSASPELFFHLHQGKVTTKPMKGTIERGKTYEQDNQNKAWLEQSKKNRMENQLTVDLMYNDLKDITIENSLQITKAFEVETYPTVFQMTSTMTGEILPDKNLIDLFKVLFPSGSITGIPKKESMELISTLEQEPREVYCGTIGYITPDNEAVFNVPIRTVLINHKEAKATYHAGGGITKNSKSTEEYEEVWSKAKILQEERTAFQLLESIFLNNGAYTLLNYHLERLKQSAIYFNFTFNIDAINRCLEDFATKNDANKWKVRLLVDKYGKPTIKGTELPSIHTDTRVELADKPIEKENVFFYHKTTNRQIYDKHRKKQSFDTLLWNSNNELTEFTIGNIVVELDNTLLTPPVEAGLLAGTFRRKLLEENKIKEKTISIHDLEQCKNIWLINSVRGWVPVYFI